MVSLAELKKMVIMENLDDAMLEKIIPMIDELRFDEQEIIFKQGERADRFYMLKRGKVVLEHRISETISVCIGAIDPGFSFGWSAMLGDAAYTAIAVCEEPCDVFSVRSEKIIRLLEKDTEMGYLLSQRIIRIIKKRLDARTEQFVTLITHHPDMKNLF